MKLTPEELSELQYYLTDMRPDTEISFRETNDEILEFNEHNLILYKTKVRVIREDPENPGQTTSNKEVVYFLETDRADVRRTTSYSDVCLAAIIFLVAEDIRMGFDLVRQDYKATHPLQEGERLLQ